MENPWIDVATLAIPRMLTRLCMATFLTRFRDRDQYRLRWLVHLDQYPGLEKHWSRNLDEIQTFAEQFDDVVIVAACCNQGFGRSVWHLIQLMEHHVLWVEDDWLWHRDFELDVIKKLAKDSFSFQWHNRRCGVTTPCYYRLHVMHWLRDYYPLKRHKATETGFKRCLHRAGFRAGVNRRYTRGMVEEIGRRKLVELGITRNFEGKTLKPTLKVAHGLRSPISVRPPVVPSSAQNRRNWPAEEVHPIGTIHYPTADDLPR